ncbi:MAG: class I SAM-dependent methyltransferase [Actinomycetota bacterium]
MTFQTTRSLAAAYDDWHRALDVDESADAPWHLLARDWLPTLSGMRVIEIGCGRGGFSAWLQHLSPKFLVAADLSTVAVQKAKEFCDGLDNIQFMVSDIQNIPFPDQTFDVVVSCETVEHVTNPSMAVRELARVLKPGGRLLLTAPNYFGVMGLLRAYRVLVGRPFTESGQPLINLTFAQRTRFWIRRSGLVLRHFGGVGHYIPLKGRDPIRLTALDRHWPLIRSLAFHTIFVAQKPSHGAESSKVLLASQEP